MIKIFSSIATFSPSEVISISSCNFPSLSDNFIDNFLDFMKSSTDSSNYALQLVVVTVVVKLSVVDEMSDVTKSHL